MEALVEAIAGFLAVIFQVTQAIITGTLHGLQAMLNNDKREQFLEEWRSSKIFRVGVFLSVTLFVSTLIMVFPFWRWAYHQSYSKSEVSSLEKPQPNRSPTEKGGLTLSFNNLSGNTSVHLDAASVKTAWEKAKFLISRKKQNKAIKQMGESTSVK